MRNRWWLLALSLILTVLLLPAMALAGGGGIIRRVKPLDRAKAGEVPIYVQALQHGVTPRSDHTVTVRAEGPGGAPAVAGPTGAAFPWLLAAGALLAGLATVGILVLWRR